MSDIIIRIILKLARKNIIKISDKKYLTLMGKLRLGVKMDLDNPKTFSEKMQWLKLYDRNPEYTKMVDKAEAKKYVASIIGEEHIIPTIGVYNSFDEINFDKLPNEFVMKATHSSGDIYICKDKNKINYEELKNMVNKWLNKKYYTITKEWPYKNVKPKVIIEKNMTTENQKELIDYKFFCFNGKPKLMQISEGTSNHKTTKVGFTNMEYKKTKLHREDYKQLENLPQKPNNFEKMQELAKKLSSNIPFVRVDFYDIENQIYFGELTFYPGGGYIPFEPKEYDKILGDMLQLPKKKER